MPYGEAESKCLIDIENSRNQEKEAKSSKISSRPAGQIPIEEIEDTEHIQHTLDENLDKEMQLTTQYPSFSITPRLG